MSTGYTAKLADEGQGFEDFVLGCARAFGPCISLRDESMDTPIPETFEPNDHHVEALETALKLQKDLADMTKEHQIEWGEKKRAEESERLNGWYQERLESNERLDDMEALVSQWVPPSDDHVELKNFMLQQIGVSKDDPSYIRDEMARLDKKLPIDFYRDACDAAARAVEYHRKESSKGVENTRFSNEWIRQLRESVKGR